MTFGAPSLATVAMVAVQSSPMETFDDDQTAAAEIGSPANQSLAMALHQETAARELARFVSDSLGVNFTSPTLEYGPTPSGARRPRPAIVGSAQASHSGTEAGSGHSTPMRRPTRSATSPGRRPASGGQVDARSRSPLPLTDAEVPPGAGPMPIEGPEAVMPVEGEGGASSSSMIPSPPLSPQMNSIPVSFRPTVPSGNSHVVSRMLFLVHYLTGRTSSLF